MKKLFIIVCLVFITGVSFAQQDSTKYVTNSNVERLVDKYTDKIEVAITSLAQELKQPVEHVYKLLVKQQVVKAATWTVAIIVALLVTIGLWILWYFDKEEKDEWWGLPVFVTGILCVLIAGTLSTILGGFINPEYGAINEIIDWIK